MSDLSVTLDNCDQEPIHIPGAIQPHGALLAFDRQGRLTHASENARELLGLALAFGSALRADTFLDAGKPQDKLYRELLDALALPRAERALQATVNGHEFDVVMHRQGDSLICEFESRQVEADVSTFAQLAFRSLNELKRSASVDELLDKAVAAVREVTGFDRVMAYRFAHDDSGEVVAEAKVDELDAYLGRRYPASDIPAQARRLYLLSTLRLIADVAYQPVALLAAASSQGEPLDLSFSVLRSVSPIHVEYLSNMGVRASMSVSIVLGGRLWGMIACHHRTPMLVPYPLRMAVDVMAQVIAATVQSVESQQREAAIARGAWVRTEVARAVAAGRDIAEIVRKEQEALRTSLAADVLFMSLNGSPRFSEGVEPAWAGALAGWLETQESHLVHVFDGKDLPAWDDSVPAEQRFCGVLALRFDGPRQGWIIALRREQVLTIRWGGKPDKVIAHGPLGPRLTPRGSFDEWREIVRGTAAPWTAVQLEIATQLLDTVGRAYSDRVVETDAMRAQLWAMLGHDLRNPLQSINMANRGITRGLDPDRLSGIIRNSTHRMNRLLGDILDMSRLQHGFKLTIAAEDLDLNHLLQQLIDETMTAHPATRIRAELHPDMALTGDQGRLAQLFANLFSNARHHGDGIIDLQASREPDAIVVQVSNGGALIPDDLVPTLFDPFKRSSMNNLKNRTGMGLGLYISAQVVEGHGGTIHYEPREGKVSFTVRLPLRARPAGADDAD